MRIWEITGPDLRMLLAEFESPTRDVHTVRIAADGDSVKVKVNEGCWTPALGEGTGRERG